VVLRKKQTNNNNSKRRTTAKAAHTHTHTQNPKEQTTQNPHGSLYSGEISKQVLCKAVVIT